MWVLAAAFCPAGADAAAVPLTCARPLQHGPEKTETRGAERDAHSSVLYLQLSSCIFFTRFVSRGVKAGDDELEVTRHTNAVEYTMLGTGGWREKRNCTAGSFYRGKIHFKEMSEHVH